MAEISVGRLIAIAIFSIVVVTLLSGVFFTIQAGQRGVMLTFGRADPSALTEGLHLKLPLIQQVVKMDVKSQKYEVDASAASKDLQVVNSKIAVNFHLVPESIPKLFSEIGADYQNRIISPAVQETVKSTTALYNAEELITKREDVKSGILASLRERLGQRDIMVEDISITNFDFSQSFNEAIEAKVTAEQIALKATNDLKRIEIEKQQTITQAEAQAQATKTKAEAEAYSLQVIREQLEKSNSLVQYKMIEKWNGVLPQYSMGNAIPLVNLPQTTAQT